VGPRYGRLYTNAVLRALTEQLVDALDVRRGETVCDLMCDAATLGVALGVAVGARGRVLLVDTDPALPQTAMPEVSVAGCAVSTVLAAGDGVAAADSTCDRVGSLCTLGFWDGESPFDAVQRMLRPSGRAVVVTWDSQHPPLHEVALADALRDVLGVRSRFLTRCLASPEPSKDARWIAGTLRDVVRFDGIGHYWAAMVGERPVASELHGDSGQDASLRAACQRALEPCTAADGTMLIPVRATMWTHTPSRT
jgi:hypothetical protein